MQNLGQTQQNISWSNTINIFGLRLGPASAFFLFYVLAVAIIIIPLFYRDILPDRFFFDERTIITFILQQAELTRFDSYSSTAYFYRKFGITGSSNQLITVSLLSYIIFATIFFTVSTRIKRSEIESTDFLIILYFLCAGSIYLTVLSKDFIVLLLIAAFLFAAKRGLRALLAWTLVATFYAYCFRSYWFLILGTFWLNYLAIKVLRKKVSLYLLLILFYFVIALAFHIVLDVPLDHYRISINELRLLGGDENARTMIHPFISGSGFLSGLVNVIATHLMLLAPIPLLLMMSPYYLVSFFVIVLIVIKTVDVLNIILKYRLRSWIVPCVSLIMAVVQTQALFEPDYGSYIRHLSPFFPVILSIILWRTCYSTRRLRLMRAKVS